MRAEPIASEIRLRQRVALDHRPHRAVEQEDAFRQKVVESIDGRHAYRWDLGFAMWDLGFAAVFSPLASSTANGSPGLLAPTWMRTSARPAPRSSASSACDEKPRWRSPKRFFTH